MDRVELDYILVADGAAVADGKLYVLGGGWTHLWVPEFPGPPPLPIYVALGLSVPWHLTNREFSFALQVQDADGQLIGEGPAAEGQFEQGRPPGLKPGTPQKIPVAVPIGIEFPEEGRYAFVCLVDGEEVGRTAIEVRRPAGVAYAGPHD